MVIYLIYKDNSYPLYSESQYRLGQNEFCDILLPLDEEIILRVDDDKVCLLDKEYANGLYDINLSNNISIDLLYEEAYFETMKYINIINKNSSLKALYIYSIASDFDFKLN